MKLVVILVLTIGCCVTASGQTLSNRQLARLKLSAAERRELIKRFQLFVEYEKTQAYDKQFELLAKHHLANLLHMDVNKESYVKFKQQTEAAAGKVLGVRVKGITRMAEDEGGFEFNVVAKVEKDGRVYSDAPIFAGYLVKGAWYFSMLYIN